ncbi:MULTISPECIES: cofactor assembly of complex C subunit B [unclassified Prochlorococcus]|uniref:cofactor assembly of complex C subunit B n=2 Tax=Prochlorococcus TaxID=1218 RepID=UPI0005339380|nr:hypothetical protein EV06_1164 [Prochlorococcus sp. MIT 0602]KGG17571.1 hypothetical protein EV07_1011 [Prochlorococcus sp. MIT 0603]
MIILCLVNAIAIDELSPSIQRSELIAALSSVSILLVGYLQKQVSINKPKKAVLEGTEAFYINAELPEILKNELAWGSKMILTATASSNIIIYYENKIVLKRGLFSTSVNSFKPGKTCISTSKSGKYISLVNTKYYPDKDEFESIVKNLPSLIVVPISTDGWIIVGGWSERCFTKSDEIWIEGWTKKLESIIING